MSVNTNIDKNTLNTINVILFFLNKIIIKIYDIHKSNDKTKRFSYNFIFKVNYKINEYTLQKEEVSDVKYVTIEEMELAREKNDSMYTFCFWDKEDFDNEIKKLKQIRKEISKT